MNYVTLCNMMKHVQTLSCTVLINCECWGGAVAECFKRCKETNLKTKKLVAVVVFWWLAERAEFRVCWLGYSKLRTCFRRTWHYMLCLKASEEDNHLSYAALTSLNKPCLESPPPYSQLGQRSQLSGFLRVCI